MKLDYLENFIDMLRYSAAKRAFDQTGIDLMKFNEMMGIPVPSEDLEDIDEASRNMTWNEWPDTEPNHNDYCLIFPPNGNVPIFDLAFFHKILDGHGNRFISNTTQRVYCEPLYWQLITEPPNE